MRKNMNKKIAIIVGSIRKESFSQSLANNIVTLLPEGYEPEFIKIDDLPLYSQDYDTADAPEQYKRFREQVKDTDAVIFVTPEHNRSYPAALKNAIDLGSRPYGQSVWNGKPALVVSQSPGDISGFGANHHLRQTLTFLNMPTLQQPEAYIGHTNKLFDEQGRINNEGTVEFLQTVIDAFIEMVELYQKAPEQEGIS
jgi:chromate reductase